MPLDHPEELSDLIRLRLAGDLLQVQQLGHGRMREDMVASGGANDPEAERFDEAADVVEACIVRRGKQPLQQFPLVHTTTLAVYEWGTPPFNFTDQT